MMPEEGTPEQFKRSVLDELIVIAVLPCCHRFIVERNNRLSSFKEFRTGHLCPECECVFVDFLIQKYYSEGWGGKPSAKLIWA